MKIVDPKFILPHAEYNNNDDGSYYNNDICLIRTPHHITKTAQLTPKCGNCTAVACIAEHPITPGNNCWIAGWGVTSDHRNVGTKRLHEAGVNVMTNAYCKSHGSDVIKRWLQPDEICAAGVENCEIVGGTDACKGDSGGPLICPIQNGGTRQS